MMKRSSKNAYAFIDSQNLNLGIRSQGYILDFKKFRLYLKNKLGVEKAFLFIGYIPENQKLYDELKSYGFELIFKPTIKHTKAKIKGNVDAELVLSAMVNINSYSKAVIVSNDGDFHCLIEYLSKKDKLLKIITPNDKYSSLYREFSRYILILTQQKGLLIKKTKISGRSKS